MSEIIKIGNAEIEKSNYNYFSMLYSKIPKEHVIADLVSKCEEYNRLYKSYEELEVKEMQKEELIKQLKEDKKKAREFIEKNFIRYKDSENGLVLNELSLINIEEIKELLEILGDKE